MAALPYIQLYVADYLADTAHLTAAEHGAYLLLIMNYWQRGQPLNNSNERLANVARMSNDEWANAKGILQEFFHIDGDIWYHSRIDADLSAVHAKSTKASNAGKASAEKRINKRSTNVQQTLNHTDTDTDTDTDTLKPFAHSSNDAKKTDDKNSVIYSKAFLAFWDLYPNKKSKGDAFKAFKKINPSEYPSVKEGLLKAIDSADWKKDGGQYIKHPGSWLRARGWEDEHSPHINEKRNSDGTFNMDDFLKGIQA